MTSYEWKNSSDTYYYFDIKTGKIVAKVNKLALLDIYIALVYTGKYTFTIDDERHLGQYVTLDHAKKAVEKYWDIDSRTLIEQ